MDNKRDFLLLVALSRDVVLWRLLAFDGLTPIEELLWKTLDTNVIINGTYPHLRLSYIEIIVAFTRQKHSNTPLHFRHKRNFSTNIMSKISFIRRHLVR